MKRTSTEPMVVAYMPGVEDLRVVLQLFLSAQAGFADHGLHFTIHFEHDDPESILGLVETTNAQVVLAMFGIPEDIRQKLTEAGVLVITPGQGENQDLWSYIDISRQVGRAQVMQCFKHGYRRVLYLGCSNYELPNLQVARLDGAREACRARGQSELPYYELPDDQDGQMEVVVRALRENPETDAICGFRDIQAAQAMTVLKAMGRAVPSNFGVIGYGDYQLCKLVRPLLSTVSLDAGNLTRSIALTVRSQLENDKNLVLFPMDVTKPIIRQTLRPLI